MAFKTDMLSIKSIHAEGFKTMGTSIIIIYSKIKRIIIVDVIDLSKKFNERKKNCDLFRIFQISLQLWIRHWFHIHIFRSRSSVFIFNVIKFCSIVSGPRAAYSKRLRMVLSSGRNTFYRSGIPKFESETGTVTSSCISGVTPKTTVGVCPTRLHTNGCIQTNLYRLLKSCL